jgi:hypothetical protein
MKLLIIVLTLLCTACASSTGTSGQASVAGKTSAAADQEASGEDQNQVVCSYETPTGSHRSIRVCRTVSQIEQDRRESEEVMRRRQGQLHHGGSSTGN